jgi:hypothetical protein
MVNPASLQRAFEHHFCIRKNMSLVISSGNTESGRHLCCRIGMAASNSVLGYDESVRGRLRLWLGAALGRWRR